MQETKQTVPKKRKGHAKADGFEKQLMKLEESISDPDSSDWNKQKYTIRVSGVCVKALRLIAASTELNVGEVLEDAILNFYLNDFKGGPRLANELILVAEETNLSLEEVVDEVRILEVLCTELLSDQTRKLDPRMKE